MSPNEQPEGHPVRRCASCRSRLEVSRLVRLVAQEGGGVCVDIERRMSGRGLNLCPNPECFEDALRKNLLRRSLGIAHSSDLGDLLDSVVGAAYGSLNRLLRDARRADGVISVSLEEVEPPSYRALVSADTGELRRRELPAVAVRNPRIAARVGRLSDLLNRFTIEQPGAKTRRPVSAQLARRRTAEESRASGEL